MSLAVEQRPAQAAMGYDQHMRGYAAQPQFTNPWTSNTSSATPSHSLYHQSPQQLPQQPASRAPSVSMPYAANPAASNLGSNLVPSRSYENSYGSSVSNSQSSYAPPPSARYSPEGAHAASPYGYDADVSRRSSYAPQEPARSTSFNDALDASRGMLAMSQSQDMTPRNMYSGANQASRQNSQDSYGFPAGHSHQSSISSASTYPSYYNGSYSGSVDGSSVTDYSSTGEDPMNQQRTLPAPNALVNGFPPEPQSMMTQFNSKMAPNAQKKHKCKICDKRFTRPSSLQTHMYSHTGEKPFACDHEGCGRHFSVVSNLRRHKKVHKGEGDPASPDDE